MPAAERSQPTLACSPAAVVRDRVVQIATVGGPAASGERTCPVSNVDDVTQRFRRPVSPPLVLVATPAYGERLDRHRKRPTRRDTQPWASRWISGGERKPRTGPGEGCAA